MCTILSDIPRKSNPIHLLLYIQVQVTLSVNHIIETSLFLSFIISRMVLDIGFHL